MNLNAENYEELTADLIANTDLELSSIFYYDHSPEKDEFNDIFSFYQNVLLLNNEKYNIAPSIIFFNNNRTINAWAWKNNDYYIISFNSGLIISLIQRFRNLPNIVSSEALKEYAEFEKSLDVPISELIYQHACHYTFYHEMGHLIQKSTLINYKIFEHLDNSNDFSSRRHLLEIDADEFSALSLGAHILQYSETMFGDNVTKDQFEKLMIISCSASFMYLLSFPSNSRSLYYEKFTHPHALIRVLLITYTVLRYCMDNISINDEDQSFDRRNIVIKMLDFSEEISSNYFPNNPISEFIENYKTKIDEMTEYIMKYQNMKLNDTSLAVHKWNKVHHS